MFLSCQVCNNNNDSSVTTNNILCELILQILYQEIVLTKLSQFPTFDIIDADGTIIIYEYLILYMNI